MSLTLFSEIQKKRWQFEAHQQFQKYPFKAPKCFHSFFGGVYIVSVDPKSIWSPLSAGSYTKIALVKYMDAQIFYFCHVCDFLYLISEGVSRLDIISVLGWFWGAVEGLNQMFSDFDNPSSLTNWVQSAGDPCGNAWLGITCSGSSVTSM